MHSDNDRDDAPAGFKPAVFIPAELPDHVAPDAPAAVPSPVDATPPRPSLFEQARDEIVSWFKTLVCGIL